MCCVGMLIRLYDPWCVPVCGATPVDAGVEAAAAALMGGTPLRGIVGNAGASPMRRMAHTCWSPHAAGLCCAVSGVPAELAAPPPDVCMVWAMLPGAIGNHRRMQEWCQHA